jgi:fido (protein-threonine AMPylation protein)
MNLAKTLSRMMRKRFPPWNSIRGGIPATFTVRMDEPYDYFHCSENPQELFDETNGLFEEVQMMMAALSNQQEEAYQDYLTDNLVDLVFGSNFIEKAGSNYDITVRLCRKIFAGEAVPDEIDERDPEYEAARTHLIKNNQPSDQKAVIRSRREIIQHALALRHIIIQMICHNETLSEQLIKDTHKILCYRLDASDGDKYQTYAGIYRTSEVVAGFNTFTPAASVPSAMKMLVQSFNADIATAEKECELDPYAIAAKYCHKFVNTHPFVDGNGRTCRLILSAILLKYAGIVIPLGENEANRTEYLDIASRASMEEQIPEDERTQPAWAELSSLVIGKANVKMRDLLRKLKNA